MILIGLLRHLRLLLFLWQPLKCTLRACALKHIKDILQFSAGSAGRVFLCFFFIIFNCFFFYVLQSAMPKCVSSQKGHCV